MKLRMKLRMTFVVAMMIVAMGTIRAQEGAPEAETAKPETSRRWMSRDGKEAWSGKFWKIERGVLEISDGGPKDLTKIPLEKLDAQDVAHLLQMERRVVWPTFQVARAGYVWDVSREKLVARSKNMRLVTGTVSSVVSNDLFIVEDKGRYYAVQNYGRKVKKGREFEAALMPTSKDKFDLGSGKKAYMCRAYGAITNRNAFRERLRTNPRDYYKILTGKSHAYDTWMATQHKAERAREHVKHREDVKEERAKAAREEKEARAKAREEEENAGRAKKLTDKMKEHQSRLKSLERKLLTEEHKKDRVRRFTAKYNDIKKRIDAIKKEISYEKKQIKSLEEEIEALEK